MTFTMRRQCLRDLCAAGDGARQPRFIAGADERLEFGVDSPIRVIPAIAERFRGKAVVLALPTQLQTIAALLQLDGTARRIILWPPELPVAEIGPAIAPDTADIIVTDWNISAGLQPTAHADIGLAACSTDMPLEQHDTSWVLFTSGTSGTPKAIVHSLESLAGHLQPGSSAFKSPIWCTFYDVRRYGGLQILFRGLLGGGSVVLSSADEPMTAFLRRAAIQGATHFLGTPTHWRKVLMSDAAPDISPAYIRLSGEVADQGILDRLRTAYPSAALVHAFASTEAGLGFEVADGLAGFPASLVGNVDGPVEMRVVDDTLRLRSSRVAPTHLRRGTRAAVDDGFVDTGDLVMLRGDRYHFVGRRDGMVNFGGQKISPEEIEAVINQHPAVQLALVKARPNPISGQIVVAEVVCLACADEAGRPAPSDAMALETDIMEFCRKRLPPHKVPAFIRVVSALGVAPSGKMLRRYA